MNGRTLCMHLITAQETGVDLALIEALASGVQCSYSIHGKLQQKRCVAEHDSIEISNNKDAKGNTAV